jgi:hypothetical protein
MVQAVLRESPSDFACSSSVRNPADLTASASSLILEDCRAFILAVSGSGRWVRACPRAAEDGRNISDECDSMHRFLWLAAASPAIECSSAAGCRKHERLSERVIVDVPRRLDLAVDEAVEVAGTAVRNGPGRTGGGQVATSVPSGRAFCICDLLRGFWRTIASPRCCLYRCRIATFFVSSFDARPRRSVACHLRARNLHFQQYGEEGRCQ